MTTFQIFAILMCLTPNGVVSYCEPQIGPFATMSECRAKLSQLYRGNDGYKLVCAGRKVDVPTWTEG